MDLGGLERWLTATALLAVSIVAGYLARFFLVRKLAQLSARTATDVDDRLVGAIKGHVPVWFVLAGALLASRVAPLSPAHQLLAGRIAAALFMLSLSFVAANVLTGFVERATTHAGTALVSATLTRNVLRALIFAIGGLLVLQNLGVEIGPLLAALGVGSLAVALALQPTLSNLFAGLHITLAKPVRIGDFIELENGVQGFIVDIDWRSTKLREGANNLVIVPNARLVEMITRNYSMPQPEQAVPVRVGASYAADLERVEAVTLEVAREVQQTVPEGIKAFEPVVRFHTFGPSSIDFDVVLRVTYWPERGALVHAFIKRLRARYASEGIEFPYPQQVVHQAPGP